MRTYIVWLDSRFVCCVPFGISCLGSLWSLDFSRQRTTRKNMSLCFTKGRGIGINSRTRQNIPYDHQSVHNRKHPRSFWWIELTEGHWKITKMSKKAPWTTINQQNTASDHYDEVWNTKNTRQWHIQNIIIFYCIDMYRKQQQNA